MPLNMDDKLDTIFKMQKALNEKIGVSVNNLSDEDKQKWILNYSRAMTQELAELTDSVPWKWWAKYQKFDTQNVCVELVDLLHFLVSAFQVMGLEAEDVFRIYCQKHLVNQDRQDEGYSQKDEDDSKHIE